jgi:hypothetical protein
VLFPAKLGISNRVSVHRTSLVKSRVLSCASAMGLMARIGVAARLKRPPVVPRNKIEVCVRYETSTKESHTPRITVVQLVLPHSRMPRRVDTIRQQSELGTSAQPCSRSMRRRWEYLLYSHSLIVHPSTESNSAFSNPLFIW